MGETTIESIRAWWTEDGEWKRHNNHDIANRARRDIPVLLDMIGSHARPAGIAWTDDVTHCEVAGRVVRRWATDDGARQHLEMPDGTVWDVGADAVGIEHVAMYLATGDTRALVGAL